MTINYDIKVTGQIASGEGHKDFQGTLREALATISKHCKEFGMWTLVNGTPFFGTNYGDEDEKAIAELLVQAENPEFVLMHPLAGGLN